MSLTLTIDANVALTVCVMIGVCVVAVVGIFYRRPDDLDSEP